MKHRPLSVPPCRALGVCLAGIWLVPLATSGAAPDPVLAPAAIAHMMQRANAHQIAYPTSQGQDRGWIRATWYTGVMAAYGATHDEAYRRQATEWSERQGWRPGEEQAGANLLTCTQTYLELYALAKDPRMIAPVIAWLDSGAPNTPTGQPVWYKDGGLRYADSLYVGPPALAMLAQATGNRKYLDWMNAFFWDVKRELYDPESHLFYRDNLAIGKRTAHGRKVLWSRGNGWAFAGIARILSNIPADDARRPDYQRLFQEMASALAARQGPDGLYRTNLADAKEFPMPESSGTGFFCYGLAWGIRTGALDRAAYLPVVAKAWHGLAGCLSPEGSVLWGQPVGAYPEAVRRDDTDEYVTGTFLLAGSEVLRLADAGAFAQP